MANSYENYLIQIGKNILKYRKEAGLTQTQLAVKTGKTKEYICMLETAKYAPSLKTLVDIATVLNTTLEELVRCMPS